MTQMKIKDLGIVIAERELQGNFNGQPCSIAVKIGKPFMAEDKSWWCCPYSIHTPEEERIFYGAGIDSLQALRIAILNIGAELSTVYSYLKVTWMGETDAGFVEKP
jgi:hypothetical protein